jgi:hypothetical protein
MLVELAVFKSFVVFASVRCTEAGCVLKNERSLHRVDICIEGLRTDICNTGNTNAAIQGGS